MINSPPPNEIRDGKDLTLKKLQPESAAVLFQAISSNRDHLSPWLPKFGDWFAIIVAQVVLLLVMRVLVDRRFSYKRLYSLLLPAGVMFLLASGLWAWKRRHTGGGVSWKDRTYKPDTKVQ